MNKYKHWYTQITERGKKSREHGLERHHILPKSLGGTDDVDNIAFITAREHFICHWLLTKIYPSGEEHWKMLNALRMMRAENPNQNRYSTKITSRVYAKLKEEYSQLQRIKHKGAGNGMFGKCHTEEAKKRIGEANRGEKNGSKRKESREKISNSKLGKTRPPFNDDWLAKIKEARQGDRNGMFGKTHSPETRIKQREKAIGRKQSAETIQKKADAIRGSKREKKLCPHCQKDIAVNTYARWHGDRCRSKEPNEN